MIGEFLADNQVSSQSIAEVKNVIYQTVMEIIEMEKNPKKLSILWRWYVMGV